jgi:hypothetical protein
MGGPPFKNGCHLFAILDYCVKKHFQVDMGFGIARVFGDHTKTFQGFFSV